jgi:hypothetical protein
LRNTGVVAVLDAVLGQHHDLRVLRRASVDQFAALASSVAHRLHERGSSGPKRWWS